MQAGNFEKFTPYCIPVKKLANKLQALKIIRIEQKTIKKLNIA
jgi:hypothetical protein